MAWSAALLNVSSILLVNVYFPAILLKTLPMATLDCVVGQGSMSTLLLVVLWVLALKAPLFLFLVLKSSWMIGTTIIILCFHMVILASMAMLAVPAFMREWTMVLTIILPPNAEVLELFSVVPAFMPEWKILWMVFLPPNVGVLALVSVVSAFMPEWTIVSTIVLPPNMEVLALVSVVPAFMPEWTIVSMIVLPPATWRFWRRSRWFLLSCQNERSLQRSSFLPTSRLCCRCRWFSIACHNG
jgi:hypothetical protein